MLHRKNGGWHQHSYLFSFRRRFKSGADGHLRLSKTNVATNQPVHGVRLLHIFLYIFRCPALVWSIFIHERRFQFRLEVTIRAIRKTWCGLSFRIQLY